MARADSHSVEGNLLVTFPMPKSARNRDPKTGKCCSAIGLLGYRGSRLRVPRGTPETQELEHGPVPGHAARRGGHGADTRLRRLWQAGNAVVLQRSSAALKSDSE